MSNKRKDRKRSSSQRIDYTQGGRVGYQEGTGVSARGGKAKAIQNERRKQEELQRQEQERIAEAQRQEREAVPSPASSPVPTETQVQDQSVGQPETIAPAPPPPQPFDQGFGNVQPGEYSDEQKPDATGAMKRTTPVSMSDPATKSAFDIGREYRTLRTGARAEDLAAGVKPEDIPQVPLPKEISRKGTEITPEQAAALQIKDIKDAEAAKVAATSPEQVSTIEDVSTASQPEAFAAANIAAEDVAKVPETAVVNAASGTVSPEIDETLAKAAGVDITPPIEGVDVEVVEGALQQRVIGTISPEAKSQAAKVAGTTLAKVTRAKKQLRNAGLSEADIA